MCTAITRMREKERCRQVHTVNENAIVNIQTLLISLFNFHQVFEAKKFDSNLIDTLSMFNVHVLELKSYIFLPSLEAGEKT